MSDIDKAFTAIEIGERVALALVGAFGLDREKAFHVAREAVKALPKPGPDQAGKYAAARAALLGDADERSELDRKRSDTDPAPPPKPSER